MFPGFQLSRYRFDLILTDDLTLPPYKGFAFRGTMGHALRELACIIQGEECRLCPFCQTCSYSYLFETVPDGSVSDARKYSSFPRPYVMKPPLEQTRNYCRYDKLSFGIVLIGRGSQFLSHIISAFDVIGSRGMRGDAGRFLIDRVVAITAQGNETEVWRGGVFTATAPVITWEELNWDECRTEVVTIEFETPMLIEDRGVAIKAAPPFRMLIESVHRRASLLHGFHGQGGGGPSVLPQGLDDCRIVSADMKWRALERITNRQEKKLKTGGLVGRVTYSGPVGPYLQLLRLGELVGVGKSTVFGFGSYTFK